MSLVQPARAPTHTHLGGALLGLTLAACASSEPTPAVDQAESLLEAGEASGLMRLSEIQALLEGSPRRYLVRDSTLVAPAPLTETVRLPGAPRAKSLDPFLEVSRAEGEVRLESHPPDDALKPLFVQAGRAFAARDFFSARRLYSKAVLARPEYFKSYTYLGNTLYFMGRYVEAERALTRALDLNPFDYQAYLFMGDTLHQLGHYHRAKSVLLSAFMLNRDNGAVKERLQSTLAKVGLAVREGRVAPPFRIEAAGEDEVIIRLDARTGRRWYPLAACMACWAFEEGCAQRSTPEVDPLRLTMYRECLLNHAASLAAREAPLSSGERSFLYAVEDGYLDAIIFWEVIAERAPAITLLLPDELRDRIRAYIDRYVLVSTQVVERGAPASAPSWGLLEQVSKNRPEAWASR